MKKNDIHFIVKTNILVPLSIILPFPKEGKTSFYSATLESCFKQRHSIQFTGGYYKYTEPGRKRKDISFSIIPEYKFFIRKKKNYTGFYSGVYGTAANYTIDADYSDVPPDYSHLKYKGTSMRAGAILGYQNYIKQRIVFDILLGMGFRKTTNIKVITAVNADINIDRRVFADGRLALNLGYKF